MKQETISGREIIVLMIMFLIGNSILMGGDSVAGKGNWISIILGAIISIPIVLIYIKIIKDYPGKNLFEISQELFGKIISNIITLLFICYALYLGAETTRVFTEFIKIVSKPETPQLMIMFVASVVPIYLIKSGIKTIGKWGIVTMVIGSIFILITFILGPVMEKMSNLLPLFEYDMSLYLKDAVYFFSFPIGETVLFLCIADTFKKGENYSKVYLYGVGLAVFIMVYRVLRNIIVLGKGMLRFSVFPSYISLRMIGVGGFLTSVESIAFVNFLLFGFCKAVIILLVICKGVKHILNINNYKILVIPLCFILLFFGCINYKNVIQLFEFQINYPYIAVWFQIVIPLLILIVTKIKKPFKKW